jgi:hypothetical protein
MYFFFIQDCELIGIDYAFETPSSRLLRTFSSNTVSNRNTWNTEQEEEESLEMRRVQTDYSSLDRSERTYSSDSTKIYQRKESLNKKGDPAVAELPINRLIRASKTP